MTIFDIVDDALRELDSEDAAVRADAVHILGTRGEPAIAGPAVERMLGDPDELVRSEAADAFRLLGHKPALEAVRRLLREDRSSLVRASAAESLGDLGDPVAIVDLMGALDDEDDAVRGFVANALGLLCGPEFLPVFDRRLGVERVPAVRAELQGGRYRLGAQDALPELLRMLEPMDEELGIHVLNLWDDLVARRPPPSLAAGGGCTCHCSSADLCGCEMSPIEAAGGGDHGPPRADALLIRWMGDSRLPLCWRKGNRVTVSGHFGGSNRRGGTWGF